MGVDTRRLTRILRETGAKNGLIVTGDYDLDSVLAKAKAVPSFTHIDFVKKVTISGQEGWNEPEHALSFRPIPDNKARYTVAALDYGIKYNILRKLQTQGAKVVRFPADAKAEDIMAINPDGIFLSNGPGDPALLDYAVDTIKGLLGTETHFRHLPGPSIVGALPGRQHVQAQVRPPRRQPSGQGSAHGQGGDHLPEPRLRRGSQ